ncbi:MAG: alpha/beta hydrolase [Alphaproteobacteria bacterium]|nr:MAG: alpha/beta hydrolase [Alphaproteobacteria bacterium]
MDLTVDGRRVFAANGGAAFDPARPAVALIHGAGMDHTVWSLQARYLAHHGHGVLAVDLPGHGRSAGPLLDSIEAMAGWIARLLDAAGIARAALVGHSMGALVALETASRHPGRVSHLGLIGIAPFMPVHPDLLGAARADMGLAAQLVTSWGFGQSGHLGRNPAPGLWMMGGAHRLLERAPAGVLANDLAACAAYQDAPDAARRVACPTLLLLGADDRMTPARKGRELAAAIDGADCRVLPGIGHMVMAEAPDETIDALADLLRR